MIMRKDFSPGPSIGDRVFWDGLSDRMRQDLVSRGESFRGYEYPQLPASLYMDFSLTGNRTRFEERYFARRLALASLVLAECACADGRFLSSVIDGIDAICSEWGWQLPAHNSYIRDTKQLVLPDARRPVLDLFACETGALLSTVRHLLHKSLDAVSPAICARIECLLDERIIKPYLESHFWWMGNGDEKMCNWTPWCTQNVLLVAASLDMDEKMLRKIIVKASYSLDCFLKDYGDDGCCDEGAQYYRHAALCFFNAIEILDSLDPGTFSFVYKEPKIRNMALYIFNVHIDGPYYFNFADCSPIAGRAGVREYFFGKAVGSPELMRFAATDWAAQEDRTLAEEINLFYRLQAITHAQEMETAHATFAHAKDELHPDQDIWYPSVGLLVSRANGLCLAVKAGGNGDSHNHNDTGSFTLYKNGAPCVIDVGVGTYTGKTFSPRRYEIWTMQSAWHNLPTFGPYMQKDGAEYKARDVRYVSDENECSISMELAGAWPAESGVTSYMRSVRFDKAEGVVVVEDNYIGTCPPVMSLMTSVEPLVSEHGLSIGSLARINVDPPDATITIEAVDLTDPKLMAAWSSRIYRMKIAFADHLVLRIK